MDLGELYSAKWQAKSSTLTSLLWFEVVGPESTYRDYWTLVERLSWSVSNLLC